MTVLFLYYIEAKAFLQPTESGQFVLHAMCEAERKLPEILVVVKLDLCYIGQ